MFPKSATRQFLPLILLALSLPARAQEDLFNHLYWQTRGSNQEQFYAISGLDTIGRISDSASHAIAVGEGYFPRFNLNKGVSSLILNRTPLDTARQFQFPGQKVIRGSINGDQYPDFVVWSAANQRITVLFGTEKVDSFVTALVLQGTKDQFGYIDNAICVVDADGDSLDDILIDDQTYQDSNDNYVGRLLYFRGGKTMSTTPDQILVGQTYPLQIAGKLAEGNTRDTTKYRALYESRFYGDHLSGSYDTIKIFVYPFGKQFSLRPSDSIVCTFDTLALGQYGGGYNLIDVDGDGIQDICISIYPRAVAVYKGGDVISPMPTYYFHEPFSTGSTTFGDKIVDLGNTTGHGYHTLLITDAEASVGGPKNGAVFLYNIGKALNDSCVAYAYGPGLDADYFGTSAIGPGDLSGDGRSDFMVGGNPSLTGEGALYVFSGSSTYGPVSVHEPITQPQLLVLSQNYPNPCTITTDVNFAVTSAQSHGGEVTLKLFDMLGRELITAYRGTADGYDYTIRLNVEALPSGEYLLRLSCAGNLATRKLQIVR